MADANVSDAVLRFLRQTNKVVRAVRLDLRLRGDSDVLAKNSSALHIAAIYGLKYIMERLLDEGTPADPRDCHGQTPLMFATTRGYLSLVGMLVGRDDVDVNAQTYLNSLTSLILAAKYVQPRAVRILLEGGADANICSDGFTALRWAVRNLDMTSIERLLEAGADPDTVVEDGPIVFYALQSIASFPGSSRFRTESLRFLNLFHKYGANFKAKDNTKRTLLHVAAQRKEFAAVEMLLAEGLDPNAIDDTGQSPLHKALEFPRGTLSLENTAIVRSLLKKGSQLDSVDHRGNTPLHIAAAEINFDALDLLLDKGAKIDSVNNEGCTPFLLAVKSSRLKMARLLLRRGANLQDRDNEGATAVHMATRSLNFLKFLVEESGAEVNVKTNDGSTPLHWALNLIHSYNVEVARYLVAHGVDPEGKNINGLTAFEKPSSSKEEAKWLANIRQTLNEELLRGPIT